MDTSNSIQWNNKPLYGEHRGQKITVEDRCTAIYRLDRLENLINNDDYYQVKKRLYKISNIIAIAKVKPELSNTKYTPKKELEDHAVDNSIEYWNSILIISHVGFSETLDEYWMRRNYMHWYLDKATGLTVHFVHAANPGPDLLKQEFERLPNPTIVPLRKSVGDFDGVKEEFIESELGDFRHSFDCLLLEAYVNEIEVQNIDLISSKKDFWNIGYILASIKDAGREYFFRICKTSNYCKNNRSVEWTWGECLRTSKGRKLKQFFAVCVAKGITNPYAFSKPFKF